MRGLGDLRAPYDASEKCIVDDKSTSSQEEQNFFIYHLRSTPIQPNKTKSTTSNQKKNWCNGRNDELRIGEKFKNGITNQINKLANMAITPVNLSGIERNIA